MPREAIIALRADWRGMELIILTCPPNKNTCPVVELGSDTGSRSGPHSMMAYQPPAPAMWITIEASLEQQTLT
jgi:hypothetical protein